MKKISLLTAPLTAVALFASCGCAKIEFGVFCNTNGVTISKSMAAKGEDYSAEIGIAKDLVGEEVTLPKTLDKVESGNRELMPEEYTYTLKENDTKADFKIPAKYVEGIINIELTLVDPIVTDANAFKEAISMTGVNYLQGSVSNTTETQEFGFENTTEINGSTELAPSIYHYISKTTNPKEVTNEETFMYEFDDGETHRKVSRDPEKETWEGKEWVELEEFEIFMTPEIVGTQMYSYIEQCGATFDSFKYDKSDKSYHLNHSGTGQELELTFKFVNNILVKFDLNVSMTALNYSTKIHSINEFAYDIVTPELPIPAPEI